MPPGTPMMEIYVVSVLGVAGLLAFLWYLNRPFAAEAAAEAAQDDAQDDRENRLAGIGAPMRTALAARMARQQPAPAVPQPSTSDAEAAARPLPLDLWIKLVEQVPHLAILGPSFSGKTTLAEAVLRKLLARADDRRAVIIDPKWKIQEPPKWGGLPASMMDDAGGYSWVEKTLTGLMLEFRARVKRLRRAEPLGHDIIVIWDEINDSMEEIGKSAGAILRRGLRIWREYRMKLIIFPQSDLVEPLGLSGHGDARTNLLWIYLGEAALIKAQELERQKLVDATFVQALMKRNRPAMMLYLKRAFILDTSEAPALAEQPLDPALAWQLPAEYDGTRVPDEAADVRSSVPQGTALQSGVPRVPSVRELWDSMDFARALAVIMANEQRTANKLPPSKIVKQLPRYQGRLYDDFMSAYRELLTIAQAAMADVVPEDSSVTSPAAPERNRRDLVLTPSR